MLLIISVSKKGMIYLENSSLVNYIKISPNRGNYIKGVLKDGRLATIKKITIHHMAVVNASLDSIGEAFANPKRECSSNYAIDSNGRVAMYCEEKNRSWCSGNSDNDNQAITIEVSNDRGAPNWHVSDKAMAKLIELCVDICKRNGIKKLNFTGDKTGNLTMHKYYQSTACPGPYLSSKFPYIAEEVNKRLNPPAPKQEYISYKVQPGDSWWGIAQNKLSNGNRYMDLVKFNGHSAPPAIHPGNIIKIPCGTSTATVTVSSKASAPKPTVTYFKATPYKGVSIVSGLSAIKVNSSYNYRSQIAKANGIINYSGTATQNTKMLNLLQKGKLIKP